MKSSHYLKILFALLIFLFVIISCKHDHSENIYNYGTQNDSSLIYFNRGWENILDYGLWTKSEVAFRKAIEFDSTFLIGHSLVGKISRDLEERIEILEKIRKEKNTLNADNLLLMEITEKTMELFNARESELELHPNFYEEFKQIGEENYRKFVHKYPEESYMKAEYIEFIHANQGPGPALDSLNLLTSEIQKEIPFFITYKALLKAELGEYEDAIKIADRFKEKLSDKTIPSQYVIYAQIYNEMDSFDLAYSYIKKAIELDTNHIIAQRLYAQLNK